MYRLKSALAVMMIGSFVMFSLPGCAPTPTDNSTPPANASQSPQPPPGASPQASSGAAPCPPFPEPTPPFVDDKLSPCIPYAVTVSGQAFQGGVATAQPAFDVFSWRSFVALNWPADPGKTIGQDGDNPTVWETYNESYQVFLEDGSAPHWGPPVDLPAQCTDASLPVFRMIAKVSAEVAGFNKGQVLDERGQPFKTGPLVDQRGEYVRFAIHLNKETFDYILAHRLYNREGQEAFTGEVDLPSGTNGSQTPAAPPAIGSMVIKSAWRVLDPSQGDKPERYHKIRAFVYTAPSDDPPVAAKCEVKTLGLVGFHVMHKTTAAPQWVWSTFEQVDNLRADAQAGVGATFFDPKHPERKINQPPPKPWDPNVKTTPTQIVRLVPVDKATTELNQKWQNLLRTVNPNSVWQFYQLISTQWPTKARKPDPKNPQQQVLNGFGAPAPPVLANSTLESYTQRSSSCIECHMNATTTNGKFGDFSYLLQRAQPEKKR